MKRQVYLILVLAVLGIVSIFAVAQTENKKEIISNKTARQSERRVEKANYKPENGYVANEETAIAIAVAVWNPIYGKEKIKSQKPFHASLKEGVWTVSGSLPKGYKGGDSSRRNF